MKNCLAILLMLAVSFALLAGCEKKEPTQAGTVSDFESQAHFQPGTSGDDSASGNTSKAPVTGEFVVSEKKYDYKDGNVELLYVENQTDRHYDITIHGAYLDENGETIKEETQTFAGFASGWSNNFIFYPRMAFDSFTYTVETKESSEDSRGVDVATGEPLEIFDNEGNLLLSYIELSYERELHWERGINIYDDYNDVRWLMLPAKMLNNHPNTTIWCDFYIMILDSDGEIYLLSQDYWDWFSPFGGCNHIYTGPVGAVEEDYNGNLPIKVQDIGGDETFLDNVQGVFTAVFAVKGAYKYDLR